MATDRITLRERVGRRLGRRYYVKDTTSGTSTVNKISAPKRTEHADEWDGATIYFTAATAPKSALVRGGSPDAGFLFLDSDLGSTPATGATYELFKSFTVEDFDRAIDEALRMAWPHVFDPLDDDTTVGETTGTIKYTLSEAWRSIALVRREQVGTTPKRWTNLVRGYDYTLRHGATGIVYEAEYDPVTGTELHFIGEKYATLGAADTDTTIVPAELVEEGALWWLYDMGPNADEMNLSEAFAAKADKARARYEEMKRLYRMPRTQRNYTSPTVITDNSGQTQPSI